MPVGLEAPSVSRETSGKLTCYHDLLLKWNTKINLISKSNVSEVWNRHIWDSAQVLQFAPNALTWLDIGSGGGFPGLVVAILASENNATPHVTLVESDQRKAAFLRTVIRELDLNATVRVARAEVLEPVHADVVSARALADLDRLLAYADRHLGPAGTALFLKGENWQKEVEIARKSWSFTLTAHNSKTNPSAAILEIEEIQRV